MPRHSTSTSYKPGNLHPCWKGGGEEYWRRQARKITNCPKGLVVHHIDKNISNNDIENLMVITQSEHLAIHNRERKGTFKKNTLIIKFKDAVLESDLSTTLISKKLNISVNTVRRIRKRYNYSKNNTLKVKFKDIVLKSDLTSKPLSKLLKISQSTILRIRKGGNINE